MKVVITGSRISSTPGHVINGWMYDYFKKHEVVQLSRSTGYDFNTDYDKALEIARSADVFVNSAAVNDCQIRFLNDLYGVVPKIISIGSIAGDFKDALDDFYPKMKYQLKQDNKLLPLKNLGVHSDLLHLTLTEVENKEENLKGLTYDHFSKILDFWFEIPMFTNIDLKYFINEEYHSTDKKEKIQRVLEYYANSKIGSR